MVAKLSESQKMKMR